VPVIREIVKDAVKKGDFISFLIENHLYYEEYFAHGLLLSAIDGETEFYKALNAFLPFIDNWAICDSVAASIKKQAKNRELLYKNVLIWLKSDKIYTVRFGIVCLMNYFIEDGYTDEILRLITDIKSDEYYINMAIAWLLSVMLVKRYEQTIPLIESKTLAPFIHNKTIDKARDSFRIDEKTKIYFKSLKI
nr:DNA alkylation repair protein [Clostridia bacterium]